MTDRKDDRPRINLPPRVKPLEAPQVPAPTKRDIHALLVKGVLPNDTLPPAALLQNPGIPPYASPNLHLARQHGIIRDGVHLFYNDVKEAWLPPPGATSGPPAPAPAAAPAPKKEEVPPVDKAPAPPLDSTGALIEEPSVLELARARDILWQDMLNNPEQRQRIERRLTKIDPARVLADMLAGHRFQQRVPIRPGVYEPVYEQLPWWAEGRLQERMARIYGHTRASEVFIQEKYIFWGLVCSLVELGSVRLASVYNAAGTDFDETSFATKEASLSALPAELVISLSVHYNFFSMRVRSLLTVEDVGNG